jgi:uncharacterized protein YjiS (DUF1127 family)
MSHRVSIRPVRLTPAGRLRWRETIEQWLAMRRSRAALLKLSDQHVRDVGLTRAIAREEARRSFLIGD